MCVTKLTFAKRAYRVCRTVDKHVIRGATLLTAEQHSAGQLNDKMTWGELLEWVWAGGGPLAWWHSKEEMRSLINSRVAGILGKVCTD